MNPQALLKQSFAAAVAAADPLVIVPSFLPAPPRGRTLAIGAGKAAASMARAVEEHWPANAPLSGQVITRYAHGYADEGAPKRIRVIEAGHPVPDESGEAAAREIALQVKSLGPDDLLLALVSGGGSSLLSLPVDGISMADLKATTRELLACGAPIQDMNVVRKHLSLMQGGKLAAMCRAPIVSLVISDVTGDAPTHIASGPTVPDPSTYQSAGNRAVVSKHPSDHRNIVNHLSNQPSCACANDCILVFAQYSTDSFCSPFYKRSLLLRRKSRLRSLEQINDFLFRYR